jgi:hypothetical protein
MCAKVERTERGNRKGKIKCGGRREGRRRQQYQKKKSGVNLQNILMKSSKII